MLTELGFGLDLETCAATGATTDLIYVSPKSGGAVSRAAGDAWRDRLLRLPAFLRRGGGGAHGVAGGGPPARASAPPRVLSPPAPCRAPPGPPPPPRALILSWSC